MAHAREFKAARSVGVDRMPPRDEAFVAGRRGVHAFALAMTRVSVSSGLSSVSARTPR